MATVQFSGLSSGINSSQLIDALIDAKLAANKKREAQIAQITTENTALDDLNTKLLALDKLIDPLRTANSGGLSKKTSSSDSDVLSASAGSNASNATYALTVTSIAKPATASYNQTYSSLSSYASTAGSGTVSIQVGTGSDQVTISANVTQNSTTVQQLVDALNSDADAGGRFRASVVNVGTSGSPSYKVVMTSLESGTEKGSIAVSASGALTEFQSGVTTIDQADDAVFHVDGILGNITRSSNSVDDVIEGLSINLVDVGSATITISNDASATADKAEEIVGAVNELIEFLQENNKVTTDQTSKDRTNIFGSLARTSLDDDFLTQFKLDISEAETEDGTTVQGASDLGISTNRDGTLDFDKDAFLAAVAADPVGVQQVLNSFADRASGVSGTIYQYTRFQGLIDISQSSNTDQISTLNDSIAALVRQTDKLRQGLTLKYASLESLSSKMQAQDGQLSSILASL